ncbi:MAG: hypothetical protein OHK0022_52630 [Roseiflexaceae bacterium]
MPYNPFTRSGALRLGHPLFRGREAELVRLEHACLTERDFFLLVYGGRQNGKTTLLLRLEERLRQQTSAGVRVCRVDFQSSPRASSQDAYRLLARSVAQVLPQATPPPDTPDALALGDVLESILAGSGVQPEPEQLTSEIARVEAVQQPSTSTLPAPLPPVITSQSATTGKTVNEQLRLQRQERELADGTTHVEATQQSSTRTSPTPRSRVTSPRSQSRRVPVSAPWVPTLVKVPAGPFLMGSADTDKLADFDENPQHRLELPDFWIGKAPVTNAQFRPFVEGDGYSNRAYWTTAGWKWRREQRIKQPAYWANSKWNGDDHPVVGVSWFEGVAYCRWLRVQTRLPFRLPSEAEWEKAARGPDGLIWPWGNQWEAGHCNSKEALLGRTSPVGQYPSGASPYGALDMAGNVWEWCSTHWRKAYPYKLEDEWALAYLEADLTRICCGGSWYTEQQFVRGAYRNGANPRSCNDWQGLRVASNSPLPNAKS